MLNEHRMFFLKQVTPDVQPGTTKMYNWGLPRRTCRDYRNVRLRLVIIA